VRDKGSDVDIVPVDGLLTAHPADFLGWLTRRGRTDDGSAYLPRTLSAYAAAVSVLYTDLYLHDLIPHVDLVRARTLPRRRLGDVGMSVDGVDPSAAILAIVARAAERASQTTLPHGGKSIQAAALLRQRYLIALRDNALTQALDATGMRIAGALSLRRTQVAHGQDEARIVGKGGRRRTVYFTNDARAAIATYLTVREDMNPYLYISHGRGPSKAVSSSQSSASAIARHQALTTGQAWRVIHALAEACAAPDVHPHAFRHDRASPWLSDGMPLEMVQELLGHASIAITRGIYACCLSSAVRDAFFAHAARHA